MKLLPCIFAASLIVSAVGAPQPVNPQSQHTEILKSAGPVSDTATRGSSNTVTPTKESFPTAADFDQPKDKPTSTNNANEENMSHRNNFARKQNVTSGKYTYDNRTVNADTIIIPSTSGTNYDPSAAVDCCLNACSDDECELGCRTWMAYSSLNWEKKGDDFTWRPKLHTRCYKQCLQPRRWSNLHNDKAKHEADHSQTRSQSYWFGRRTAQGFHAANTNPYSTDANNLPFHTAHHCTSGSAHDDHCGMMACGSGGDEACGRCSDDHDFSDVKNPEPVECINLLEVKCKEGCDKFKVCQADQG